jgi:hypothetical protein
MDLELSNSRLLDNEFYSGTDGKKSISPEMAATIASAGTAVLGSALSNRNPERVAARQEKRQEKKDLKSVCGRKPLFGFMNKKKKAEYDKCAAQYNADQRASKSSSDSKSVQESPMEIKGDDSGSNLGMIIGISVAALAVLSIGGYFLFRQKAA